MILPGSDRKAGAAGVVAAVCVVMTMFPFVKPKGL
jgi:hypothetical protein